jgi:hypothetical protein
MEAQPQMNRLFIILGVIAGITGGAWALRHSSAPATGAPMGANAKGEVPTCCQKSPSRTSLLTAKPAVETAR